MPLRLALLFSTVVLSTITHDVLAQSDRAARRPSPSTEYLDLSDNGKLAHLNFGMSRSAVLAALDGFHLRTVDGVPTTTSSEIFVEGGTRTLGAVAFCSNAVCGISKKWAEDVRDAAELFAAVEGAVSDLSAHGYTNCVPSVQQTNEAETGIEFTSLRFICSAHMSLDVVRNYDVPAHHSSYSVWEALTPNSRDSRVRTLTNIIDHVSPAPENNQPQQ